MNCIRRGWSMRLTSVPLALALLGVVSPVVVSAEPDDVPGVPVTGVLNDWQKAVCAPGTFAPGSPATMSRNWAGATREGTCGSRVNPGLDNTIWITQWTANEQMTGALQSNFMALFASAATDQTGIITFSVAQASARPSLEPLTRFGFQISPVPPLD